MLPGPACASQTSQAMTMVWPPARIPHGVVLGEGSHANSLYGVAATSASNAWAVGSYPIRTHRTLILDDH